MHSYAEMGCEEVSGSNGSRNSENSSPISEGRATTPPRIPDRDNEARSALLPGLAMCDRPTSSRPQPEPEPETHGRRSLSGQLNTQSSSELPSITVRISIRKVTPPAMDDEMNSIRLPDEVIDIIAQAVLKG